jgi:hypothetical protein
VFTTFHVSVANVLSASTTLEVHIKQHKNYFNQGLLEKLKLAQHAN